MENLPLLFLPKENLPPGVTVLNILRKLEFVYGKHKGIDVRDFSSYFSIYFTQKAMARKCKQDGLDFGEALPTICNNILEHLMWQMEKTEAAVQQVQA